MADPGQIINLSWQTSNAESVTVYRLNTGGQFASFWNVDASGTMSYTIASHERNSVSFMLFAGNEDEESINASLNIALTCPDDWFFAPAPDGCPASKAVEFPAAEQRFENGLMLWVGDENPSIYVLYEDGASPHWRVYQDNWAEGEPVNDPDIVPPDGFFQPIRGFGLTWREEPGVRERLGWAITQEFGFTTARQSTSYSKYNDLYLRAMDHNVWRLLTEGSGWEKIVAP